jgi:hypothetical protein
MVCIRQTVINIIIQFNINYNHFEEKYEIFLENLNTNDLRKEANIPITDHLKKNGTFDRDIYYLINCNLKYTRIKIQKLQWTTNIDGKEKKIYISVFPSFVIKYNKVSADTIEYISKTTRKGEDIFTVINDLDCILSSEDLLHKACQKVNEACSNHNYASILNTRYTEVYEVPISFPELINEINDYRYSASYELYRTGKIFTGKVNDVLATLNRSFKFLR